MILNTHRPWKPAADDRYLTVVSGHLWMTRQGGDDVVLGPGDTLKLDGRNWLAQALGHGPCEFVTSQTSPDHRPCPGPSAQVRQRTRRPA